MPPRRYEIKWLTPKRDLTYWVHHEKKASRLGDRPLWDLWTANKFFSTERFSKPNLDSSISYRRRQLDLEKRKLFSGEVNFQHSNGPAALLLTCRLVHQEASDFFYGNASFGFGSRKILQKFLRSIGPLARVSVRDVRLQHETYGEPEKMADRKWKLLHDDLWAKTCWEVAECLPRLENLKVLLLINDRPLQLNLAAVWAAPLLAFRGRNLKKVTINLLGGDYARLQSCEQVIRRELLGAEYWEDEKKETMKTCERKALRCLVIR